VTTVKEAVFTDKAPRPVGPYSQAIVAGDLVFISGQIPIDPRTGKLVEGDFEDQVRRVLENIKAILEAAGLTLDDVVKVTAFLKDPSKFQDFNRVYSEYFKGSFPARTTVFVADLPAGAQVEVEAIALRPR
jgi:2-iminobutanoate/2-iminopropanoate deaminase